MESNLTQNKKDNLVLIQIQSFESRHNSEDIQQRRRSQVLKKNQPNSSYGIQPFSQLWSILMKALRFGFADYQPFWALPLLPISALSLCPIWALPFLSQSILQTSLFPNKIKHKFLFQEWYTFI